MQGSRVLPYSPQQENLRKPACLRGSEGLPLEAGMVVGRPARSPSLLSFLSLPALPHGRMREAGPPG